MSDALQALTQKYIASLAEKRQHIESAQESAKSSNTLEDWDALRTLVHKLAGSAGAYGFKSLGDAARDYDLLLKEHNPPEPVALQDCHHALIHAFDKAITSPEGGIPSTAPANAPNTQPDSVIAPPIQARPEPELLLVEDDPETANLIREELASYGFKVQILLDPDQLAETLGKHTPDAILMDLMFPQGPDHGIQLISQCRELLSPCPPIVVVSGRDELDIRLKATHAGASGYFSKPIDFQGLLSNLRELLTDKTTNPYRVLIIDDDEDQADLHRTQLIELGFEAAVLSNLPSLLQTMVDFDPELLLMDMQMPDYDGIDLTQVIRQHQRWFDIPLIFLSADPTLQTRQRALRAGADSFLAKGISQGFLASVLTSRIRRYRRIQRLHTQDPLTGILNRASLEDQINVELSRAQRENLPLCLAVLDIDRFKTVNDKHGHLVGDTAIKHLSTILLRSLRRTDVLGRYGGDEMVVLLPDTSLEDGQLVMEKARADVENSPIELSNGTLSITISIGIANTRILQQQNHDEIGKALFKIADTQLYEAKQAGRNRVCATHYQH